MSIITPIIRQLIIPPIVATDAINENCSSVTENPYALRFLISFSAGELHPRTDPAASAPVVAIQINNTLYKLNGIHLS